MEIATQFENWADIYFTDLKINTLIGEKEMYNNFNSYIGENKKLQFVKFKNLLESYFKLKGYELKYISHYNNFFDNNVII